MHVPPQLRPLRIDAPIADTVAAQRRVASWSALAIGATWAGVLVGLLLGLGRVPWLEAVVWSLASGFVVFRSVQVALRRTLAWLLAPCMLELGMSDPPRMREALPRALQRRGYRLDRRSMQRDAYAPRRGEQVLPRLTVAWSGPGAIVTGPRWLVRLAARLAVG